MKTTWKTEWTQWVMLATMFGLAAWRWPLAGNRIPVHWGLDGQIDRYGGKFEGLLGLPLLALGLYALFLVLPRLDPGRANYAQFAKSYGAIRAATLGLLLVIYLAIIATTAGYKIEMTTLVCLAMGAMFLVVGNAMGKIRPNWLTGIRTPWTLSSKVTWIKTHRAGGWTFIAMGVAQIVAALAFSPSTALIVMTVLPIAASLGLIAYSYFVWQGADDKTAPAGTLPAE